MSTEKRCLYEVLGLSRDCSSEEIRSSYKKLALQRHPDKLIKSGIPESEATAQFQELVHAYEVLSDPKERAWYDSHRSQILFSDPNSSSNSVVPDLFSFFSNTVYSGYGDTVKGFYRVYSDVFSRIYSNEVNFARKMGLGLDAVREAPVMGNLESDYSQVTAFYNYWLGFSTVMDFCWVDQYDAMAGVNRKSRRLMEEENRKLRKKARREYNETVRGLAEFVKKRDKRVVDMMMKRNMEMERKREEERERKKRLEREKAERAKKYEEPEWAKVDEEEYEVGLDDWEEEKGKKKGEGNEFYCVACGKKFKSEKQWKNHEQSKKHKEKVAELRESFADEDEYMEAMEENERDNEDDTDLGSEHDEVGELGKQFKESVSVAEQEKDQENVDEVDFSYDEEDGYVTVNEAEEINEVDGVNEDEDDEMSILKAMISGHKKKKNLGGRRRAKNSVKEMHVGDNNDEVDLMEYNNRKGTRNGRAKKERGKSKTGEGAVVDDNGFRAQDEDTSSAGNINAEESPSHSCKAEETISKEDDQVFTSQKTSSQLGDRKGDSRKQTNAKLKNSSRGKKAKASSKNSDNICEKCGQEFESRNKLHKHLNETGHASLKYR